MPTARRIYVVAPKAATSEAPPQRRLVRATNQAHALRHVATEFSVDVATPDELVELAGAGVKVEEAGGSA